MRKAIIVGNWKMNKTPDEATEFINEIESYISGNEACDYGIGAPFIDLDVAVKNSKNLIVAAQNCHFEESGAFTGEVSVPMLKALGLTYCIIGHSERRQMFNETDETVSKKAYALLHSDIIPIVCIGETEQEYEQGKTKDVLESQIEGSLKGICEKCAGKLVIAYEPIWAIGTGKSANMEIAQNCCHIVREKVRQLYGDEAANNVRIQYGGSVKPENIKEYMSCPDIDGALIGGASLKTDSFKAIIDATK